MTKDKALDLALEALATEEYRLRQIGQSQVYPGIGFAITAIKQARSAPVQEPDLSGLKPKSQKLIRQWLEDGTFVERAIGALHEQELENMRLEKLIATAAQPTTEESSAVKPAAPVREPDYAWPTIADYEKEVGFAVNDTFKAAWKMARATNDLFTRMGNT
jgi:hypothetical protein